MNFKLLDTGANSGAHNMAVDEELLGRAQAGESVPVLRFYTWDPPAVTLGRFQDSANSVDAEACKTLGFDIVRRFTGGRAVLHRDELTYCVVARADNPLFPSTVLGTYKVIATALLAGLKNLGLAAEMVSHSSRYAELVRKDAKEAACFCSPSWYEIVANGRKIVGNAQRRVSGAFLQHGSILIKYDGELEARVIPGGCKTDAVTSITRELGREVPLEEVKRAFVRGFAEALGVDFLS